jgi:hypothetical protein
MSEFSPFAPTNDISVDFHRALAWLQKYDSDAVYYPPDQQTHNTYRREILPRIQRVTEQHERAQLKQARQDGLFDAPQPKVALEEPQEHPLARAGVGLENACSNYYQHGQGSARSVFEAAKREIVRLADYCKLQDEYFIKIQDAHNALDRRVIELTNQVAELTQRLDAAL